MNQLTLDFSIAAPDVSPGVLKVTNVLKALEATTIVDTLANSVDLMADTQQGICGQTTLRLHHKDDVFKLHTNAISQLCAKLRCPAQYLYGLLRDKDWGPKLAVVTLDELFLKRAKDKRFLLRSVNGTIRGFLSSSYKRLDSIKLINSFSTYAGAAGAQPHDAMLTDLHVCVVATKPDVWDIGGTRVCVGVIFKNSEFGVGRAGVQFYVSLNGYAMFSSGGPSHTHRGRRMTEDNTQNDTTYANDTDYVASAIEKHVAQHMHQDNLDTIKTALLLREKKEVKVDEVDTVLRMLPLAESEVTQAALTFRDTANSKLPPRLTQLRLAASIAWVADACTNPDQKLNLMQIAGGVLLK